MRRRIARQGSVLIMALFVISFVSILILGFSQMVGTDLMISRNLLGQSTALDVAEAGIEDAISQLRANYLWHDGFINKSFPDDSSDSYTVTVVNTYPTVRINSNGTALGQYHAHLQVDLVVMGTPLPGPYPIRIDRWEILP